MASCDDDTCDPTAEGQALARQAQKTWAQITSGASRVQMDGIGLVQQRSLSELLQIGRMLEGQAMRNAGCRPLRRIVQRFDRGY